MRWHKRNGPSPELDVEGKQPKQKMSTGAFPGNNYSSRNGPTLAAIGTHTNNKKLSFLRIIDKNKVEIVG